MALSFEESKRLALQNARAVMSTRQAQPSPLSVESSGVVPAAGTDENFIKSGSYTWYNDYSDDSFSLIDENKEIAVNSNQINITQEDNSQVIPFEMPRFYDGVDLMKMTLQIHYVNADKAENYTAPVNVSYSPTRIRFYWLVSNYATIKDGTLQFEIMASGAINVPNSNETKNYLWRTKPNDQLVVLKSLTGTGMIDPTGDDWYTQFLGTMSQKVGEAQQAALEAKESAEAAKAVVEGLDEKLAGYYTKNEVDGFIELLRSDMSEMDSLSNLIVRYEPESNTLIFMNGATEIQRVTLNTDPSADWIASYDAKVDEKISTAVDPVKDDLSSYKTSTDAALSGKAEKSALDTVANDLNVTKNAISGLQESLDNVNNDITDLQEKLENFEPDENVGREYDITYEDSKLSLLENGEIKTQVIIQGGSGGGGGGTSTITIERIGESSFAVISGDPALIKFNFSSVDNTGDDTGDATAVWRVDNTDVATQIISQGENSFDITKYLHTGQNKIKLTVTDSVESIATKTWNVNVVEFYLESSFDDTLAYNGDVTFRYTPYGSIDKTISFILDGQEIGTAQTSVTGRQMLYTIPAQAHGSHLFEVKMTAEINGKQVASNVIKRDIMWVLEGETDPIISCSVLEHTAKQYSNVAIKYTVYDPASSVSKVTLSVDGRVTSTLTVGRLAQTWTFKSAELGEHTLTIACGDTVKTITVIIEELGITIEPVTTNLAFDFNPAGRTNSDENRLWGNGNTSMTVSDNFDWSNGGYQIDEDGDTYFCVKSGTTATIDYKLFADDAKKLGKNFKVVFKTTNVKNYDATAITCMNNGIGVNIQAQKVSLFSEQNRIELPTCEDDFMEFEFNILPDSVSNQMVLWIDGIPCKVELYAASDNFTQRSPAVITIGSDDCDVHVYRMKSYMMNLTDDEILYNFVADATNAEKMLDRYKRNDITDASHELSPDILAEKCPDLRIIKISAPTFTTGSEVSNTTVQQIYKNGRTVEDNWTATGSHKGQGTSSSAYGESSRNIDINLSGGFVFGNSTTGNKYAMTENSVPENYFNIKVNVASSENANNAILADEYNEFNPYQRAAKKNNPKVRDTMEFHPCVIFIQETDTDNATIFKDGQWHFYSCGDFGNSKKNHDTMGMDPENHKEFIVELCNNTNPQVRFLSDDLSAETWDGEGSFEFRYSNPECTSEELQAGKDAVQTLLTWVVNADDDEFVVHFEDHFIKDSALFFYLFTERHTMVDNRAKNVFMHTEDLIHWDFCFDYDNDTAMGNDNEGGLTLTYGYEDTDTIGSKNVFNAADSKLWCKVRDLFKEDLEAMFISCESKLAWSASRLLKKKEQYQQFKPERLWIADMRRKYFRTYEDNGTESYLPMMNGDKRHQCRQFEKYQEKYIASKYSGTTATSDNMTIRGYTPNEWTAVEPDGTFRITPYADTYVSVKYGSTSVKKRGKRGQVYEIQCPIDAMNDTEVYVYNASIIQSIGDISGFYPGYVDFSHGIKLTDLQVGNGTEGYSNTNMNDFAVGNNTLLEHLNLQNVPKLNKSIDLTGCTNLETFLAEGSGITGVNFAKGGKIQSAHLPAIASLSMKSLSYLTDLVIESYDNLVTLTVENCSSIDELELVNASVNLSRVRLTGIDWQLDDTSLLKRLYAMTGLNEAGYNTEHSVVEGKVHVPVIREKELSEYNKQWPDLEITYSSIINQFAWTFINDDGTILDVQYVDLGSKAVDPITREIDPIPTPTKESSVSTDFTFSGWDTEFTTVFGSQTVKALYSESVRNYTIRYLNHNIVLKTTVAPYGSLVLYDGDTPSYTTEESSYTYYLFKEWDKSGYVDGNKDINAVFDSCRYTTGYFDGKDISELRPVEIYAMTKAQVEKTVVTEKDSVTIQMGTDFNYSDVTEKVLIESETVFNGSNHIDTNISLFDEDRSFVLAVDYKINSGSAKDSVFMDCYSEREKYGLKMFVNNGTKIQWAGISHDLTSDYRNMLVIRHIKGENGIHVYSADVRNEDSDYFEMDRNRATKGSPTLVFGCQKADDGTCESYASGIIYWAKLWYTDLGDSACKQLVSWTHESVEFEVCGFNNYYLSDGSNKRCSLTFLQKGVFDGSRKITDSNVNTGGWAACTLNRFMNARLLNAFPIGWRQLLKQVEVNSAVGNKITDEISSSDCYFFIPSVYEVDPSKSQAPFIDEAKTISYMSNNESRIKYDHTGAAVAYWLRSPSSTSNAYFWFVKEDGGTSSYGGSTTTAYVASMFCV